MRILQEMFRPPAREVERPAEDPAPAEAPATPTQARLRAQDAYIAGRLATVFQISDLLAPYPLRVEVTDHQVLLTGTLPSDVLRDLAVEIAGSIEGVTAVYSKIRIAPACPAGPRTANSFAKRFRDACTTARVKSRLLWNGNSHGFAIHVTTKSDVVQLSGSVRNPVDRDLAEQIALLTRGVRQVENLLILEPSMAAA